MGGEGNRCPTPLVKSLLVLFTLHLAQRTSSLVNITECSVPNLILTLIDVPGRSDHYDFYAACRTKNGTCFYGEEPLGYREIPRVGDTRTINVHPKCTRSDKVSPGEMERCTLVISSTIIALPLTSGAATMTCELPGQVSTSLRSDVKQPSSSVVNTTPPATGTPPSTILLASVVPGALLSILLIIIFIVAIVSSLMWMRSSRIMSRYAKIVKMDVCNITVSPSILFDFGDDISRDVHTVCDSIVFDEEAHIVAPDGSCLMASYDCHTACIPVGTPSQTSSGYVGIELNPQQ